MSTPYDVMFGLPALSGKVEIFGNDVTRTRVVQSKFFQHGRMLATRDGNVKWDEVTKSRGLAPVAGYKGRHRNKAEMGRVERTASVAVIKRSVELDASRMFFERATGELDPNAEAYVEEEMSDLVTEVGNTIEYFGSETLRGTLTVNSTNIPDSTQSFTLTFSPNTFTNSAGWATAGTGILSSEIPAAKIDYEQTCGLSPQQALITNAVEGYMYANTEVTGFVGDVLGQRFIEGAGTLRGPAFSGLRVGGLDWEIYEGGYVPDGGSFTRYLPTVDEAIFLPENAQLGGVLGYALGQGLVPQQELGPASAAARLIQPAAPGWYSYSKLVGDGPTVKLYVGWVGLLVPIRPDAIMVGDLD